MFTGTLILSPSNRSSLSLMRSSWHVSRIKSVLILFRQHISISRYKYLVSDTDGSVVSQRCADSEAASTSFIQSIVKKKTSQLSEISTNWLFCLTSSSKHKSLTRSSEKTKKHSRTWNLLFQRLVIYQNCCRLLTF